MEKNPYTNTQHETFIQQGTAFYDTNYEQRHHLLNSQKDDDSVAELDRTIAATISIPIEPKPSKAAKKNRSAFGI